MVFNKSAKYYDVFLESKYGNNKKKEINYIDKVIKKYKNNAQLVLDLGCGTGRHSLLLSKKNYTIVGIDKSKEMIKKAIENRDKTEYYCDFIKENIETFNLENKYDVALCLFETFDYIEDIEKAVKNINKHLKKNSLFIFSFINKEKLMKSGINISETFAHYDNILIKRTSIPQIDYINNIVEIAQVFTGSADIFCEIHKMKYFLFSEINDLLEKHGFKILKVKNKKKSWSTTMICKKVKNDSCM